MNELLNSMNFDEWNLFYLKNSISYRNTLNELKSILNNYGNAQEFWK